MRRIALACFGWSTQLLFLAMLYPLYTFLRGSPSSGPFSAWKVAVDVLLACQFAVSHSLLLHPRTRSFLNRWVNNAFYGCLFCIATCGSLLLTIGYWQSGPALWIARGPAESLLTWAFWGSWAALFYSLALTGLGYQTGWLPFWYWLRNRPLPRREFHVRGAYRFLRHPVYLSFLGLVWFTPYYTADRLLLNCCWSVYLYHGSILKDRRLEFYLGDVYRRYMAGTAGYPGIFWGPLARLRPAMADQSHGPSLQLSGATTAPGPAPDQIPGPRTDQLRHSGAVAAR